MIFENCMNPWPKSIRVSIERTHLNCDAPSSPYNEKLAGVFTGHGLFADRPIESETERPE